MRLRIYRTQAFFEDLHAKNIWVGPHNVCVKRRANQGKFVNLISTMVLVAIVAILSMVAVPDWIQAERNATLSSAAEELSSARLALQRSAAEDTGATLSVSGSLITVTGSGGESDWTGHLPNDAAVFVNGHSLRCVSLSGDEIPATSSTCKAEPSSPMVWSAQLDGQTETLP